MAAEAAPIAPNPNPEEAAPIAANPNEASVAVSGGGPQAPASEGYPSGEQKASLAPSGEEKASLAPSGEQKPPEKPLAPSGEQKAAPSAISSPASRKSDVSKGTRSVGFDTRSNTVNSYTPSDSSEEWDPNAEDDEDSDDPRAPKEISGYLWKKSPSRLLFCKYQKRYFRVKNTKIHWWYTMEEYLKGRKKAKGCLDLKDNFTAVTKDSSLRFTLEPRGGGAWTGRPKEGRSFTGMESGRKFFLDTTDSEHDTTAWIQAIEAQIEYSKQYT